MVKEVLNGTIDEKKHRYFRRTWNGHPIVEDSKYGENAFKKSRKGTGLIVNLDPRDALIRHNSKTARDGNPAPARNSTGFAEAAERVSAEQDKLEPDKRFMIDNYTGKRFLASEAAKLSLIDSIHQAVPDVPVTGIRPDQKARFRLHPPSALNDILTLKVVNRGKQRYPNQYTFLHLRAVHVDSRTSILGRKTPASTSSSSASRSFPSSSASGSSASPSPAPSASSQASNSFTASRSSASSSSSRSSRFSMSPYSDDDLDQQLEILEFEEDTYDDDHLECCDWNEREGQDYSQWVETYVVGMMYSRALRVEWKVPMPTQHHFLLSILAHRVGELEVSIDREMPGPPPWSTHVDFEAATPRPKRTPVERTSRQTRVSPLSSLRSHEPALLHVESPELLAAQADALEAYIGERKIWKGDQGRWRGPRPGFGATLAIKEQDYKEFAQAAIETTHEIEVVLKVKYVNETDDEDEFPGIARFSPTDHSTSKQIYRELLRIRGDKPSKIHLSPIVIYKLIFYQDALWKRARAGPTAPVHAYPSCARYPSMPFVTGVVAGSKHARQVTLARKDHNLPYLTGFEHDDPLNLEHFDPLECNISATSLFINYAEGTGDEEQTTGERAILEEVARTLCEETSPDWEGAGGFSPKMKEDIAHVKELATNLHYSWAGMQPLLEEYFSGLKDAASSINDSPVLLDPALLPPLPPLPLYLAPPNPTWLGDWEDDTSSSDESDESLDEPPRKKLKWEDQEWEDEEDSMDCEGGVEGGEGGYRTRIAPRDEADNDDWLQRALDASREEEVARRGEQEEQYNGGTDFNTAMAVAVQESAHADPTGAKKGKGRESGGQVKQVGWSF